MAKIDRLGWAAGTCVDAYGVRIGIRVNDPSFLERLPGHLPPGWKPLATPIVDQMYSIWIGGGRNRNVRRYSLLYSGVARRARSLALDEVCEIFEADLRLNVAAASRRLVFVHAGVVAFDGRALLVPGRSGAGKTTLVAALLRAGATYYSDEFAVLDGRGRVHPFPKTLSVRDADGRGTARVPPEDFGAAVGTRPLPVGLVALSTYRAHARWRPVSLSAGQALLAMLPHTVPVRRRPAASLTALQRALVGAVVVKGARGEADDTATRLLERLENDRRRGRERGSDTAPSGEEADEA
jgi:energy-coupling factor transporter ATP-binding protein EcfA2